jgi:hypothetical protein
MPTTSPLRPTANINSVWTTFAATSIDDAVTQPSAGSGDTCSINDAVGPLAQQWRLDAPTGTGVITSTQLWVRYRSDANNDGAITAVRVRLNGTWHSGTLTGSSSSGSYVWNSCTLTAAGGSYGTNVGSAPAVELTYVGAAPDSFVDVDVVYLVNTYSSYPAISGAPVIESTAVTDFSANQTTHTINLPSGITAGDYLAVWFCRDGTTGTVTTPSGWSATIGPLTQTDMSHLFTKFASGSEGSTLSITTSVSESSSAIAIRASGVTAAVAASFTTASNLSYANPPLVTATATAGCVLMAFGSATGSNFAAEVPNGTPAFTFAIGNTADPGNTVCAFSLWATCSLTSGDVPIVNPYRWSTATSYRGASLLLQGSAPSGGGGSGVRLVNVRGGADQ